MAERQDMNDMPRYLPQQPLPPYSYFPNGPWPHPISHPEGHSRGHHPQGGSVIDDLFRWGVDLFNHGFYWEAHEAWEEAWAGLGRRGELADGFKGLVHLAAAGVKVREGVAAGVRSHLARAAELLNPPAPELLALGLEAASLLAASRSMKKQSVQERPDPSLPVVVLSTPLRLTVPQQPKLGPGVESRPPRPRLSP